MENGSMVKAMAKNILEMMSFFFPLPGVIRTKRISQWHNVDASSLAGNTSPDRARSRPMDWDIILPGVSLRT